MTVTGEDRPVTDVVLDAPHRVVLLDVRAERRKVMRAIVEQTVGVGTVVAEAATAEEAVAAVERDLADVAVVEIQLPVVDGLAAIAALRQGHRALRIVVCSFHREAATRQQAQEAGADCYLTKPISGRDLRRALDSGQVLPLVAT